MKLKCFVSGVQNDCSVNLNFVGRKIVRQMQVLSLHFSDFYSNPPVVMCALIASHARQ